MWRLSKGPASFYPAIASPSSVESLRVDPVDDVPPEVVVHPGLGTLHDVEHGGIAPHDRIDQEADIQHPDAGEIPALATAAVVMPVQDQGDVDPVEGLLGEEVQDV